MGENDKNFEFGSAEQYPIKSDPKNRMIYDILRQIQTIQGVKGDQPAHEWDGTKIRFENPDGSWGAWVDVVGEAGQAPNVQAQYSIDGATNWHEVYVEGVDKYFRHSYDGGSTWGYAIVFGGNDGIDGNDGDPAPNVLIQYSIDGATDWHNTPAPEDNYIRFSNDNGSTWTNGAEYRGPDGDPALDVVIQYSVDGNTWHTPYGVGTDKYIRFSTDGGNTWEVEDRFIGTDGIDGSDGTNQYLYIAWADDDQGNGFTMTFNATKTWRAEIQSTVVISNPQQSDFTGKWMYTRGADGDDGQDVYQYIAYASDDQGTNFTLVNDDALDYMAILLSYTVIASPQASDFTGLWFKRRGPAGSNAYYMLLPNAANVTGRCNDPGVVAPPWTFDSGDQMVGNPLSSSAYDLVIQHNLGKAAIAVEIHSKTATKSTKLVGAVAYSTYEIDQTNKNYLCIKSLATIATDIEIYITFIS